MNFERFYKIVLSIGFVLFAILFVVLSFNSRLATDDYYFIGDTLNHGMLEQVWFQYMNWSGRYTATLPINIIYNLFQTNQEYYYSLPLISFFLLLVGLILLINEINKRNHLSFSKFNVFILGSSFVSLLFFLSYNIGESWFWYCGYSSYLWSITALIWGLFLLTTNKNNPIHTILATICFIYIGGASEIYSSIIGLIYTIFLYKKYQKKIDRKSFVNENRKLIVVYLFFGISFIIFLVAPGNYLRDGLFPEHNFIKALFITAKSIIKFFIIYFPSKIPYIIAFGVPFAFIGNQAYAKGKVQQNIFSNFKKITSLFLAISFLFLFLVAFVMVETGPARVLFFLSFMLTIYFAICFFQFGLNGTFQKYFKLLSIASILLILGITSYNLFEQSTISTKYAKAIDERVLFLKKLKAKNISDTLIILKPLPPSGMLYSAEISSDTTHFTNRELKMGYNLNFNVAIEKK